MLRLEDVHVHIGKLHILQGVNLSVDAGECAALLGRNGVGKTTTLRAIMGLARKTRGTVEFDGIDLARCQPHEVPRKGIGYVPQGRGIFPNLTVMENLNIGLPGKRDPEREEYVFGCFPRLQGAPQAVRKHPLGWRATDAGDCPLPDDASQADHPRRADRRDHAAARLQIRREIHRISRSGVSILLVEQNVETALKLCPRVFLMEKGTIVYSGASHDLKSQPEIVHRYLGVSR